MLINYGIFYFGSLLCEILLLCNDFNLDVCRVQPMCYRPLIHTHLIIPHLDLELLRGPASSPLDYLNKNEAESDMMLPVGRLVLLFISIVTHF